MYRVLSLSGGGVKGYLTCLVLTHLEDITGKRISDMFDLVVGSSSGAFIAAALDHLPASYCASLFRDTMLDRLFKPNLFNFFGLLDTKYDSDSKCEVIKEILADKPSTNSYDYAILSYDLVKRRPVVFNSLEEFDDKYLFTNQYNLADAVCASTAAPLYWDPYHLDDMVLLDGAFLSNNPTSVGIKLALDNDKKLEDLIVVDIGAGLNTRSYDFKSGHNPIKWLAPTFNILMTSQSQLTEMLFTNEQFDYYNLDTSLLIASDDIDDTSNNNIVNLEKEASNLIFRNAHMIDGMLDKLLQE